MSKPHARAQKSNTTPALPGQSKIMFYTEGNPAALLVITKAGKPSESTMDFPKAEAALEWCRQHGANLYYMSVNLSHQ